VIEVGEIVRCIRERPEPRDELDLFVPDSLSVDGQPVDYSAGMAIIGNTLLAEGFLPAPFTVVDGGRVYHLRSGVDGGVASLPTLRSLIERESGDE
jgi:hypothetical protein